MQTALKIALALGGVGVLYMLYSDSLAVGDQVIVSSAAFPGAATTPEVAALVPPNARAVVQVTGKTATTFSGQLVGFSFRDPVTGTENFTSLARGPLLPALDRKGIVGKR
jgi:hypothetical protein